VNRGWSELEDLDLRFGPVLPLKRSLGRPRKRAERSRPVGGCPDGDSEESLIVVYNLLVFIPVGVALFVGLIFKALVGDRTAAFFGGLAGARVARTRQQVPEPSCGLSRATALRGRVLKRIASSTSCLGPASARDGSYTLGGAPTTATAGRQSWRWPRLKPFGGRRPDESGWRDYCRALAVASRELLGPWTWPGADLGLTRVRPLTRAGRNIDWARSNWTAVLNVLARGRNIAVLLLVVLLGTPGPSHGSKPASDAGDPFEESNAIASSSVTRIEVLQAGLQQQLKAFLGWDDRSPNAVWNSMPDSVTLGGFGVQLPFVSNMMHITGIRPKSPVSSTDRVGDIGLDFVFDSDQPLRSLTGSDCTLKVQSGRARGRVEIEVLGYRNMRFEDFVSDHAWKKLEKYAATVCGSNTVVAVQEYSAQVRYHIRGAEGFTIACRKGGFARQPRAKKDPTVRWNYDFVSKSRYLVVGAILAPTRPAFIDYCRCLDDKECAASPNGPFCYAGKCGWTCTGDSQCPFGDICESGTCTRGCRNDKGCNEDAYCSKEAASPDVGKCLAGCRDGDDSGCTTGSICIRHECTVGCRADRGAQGCQSGEICVHGDCAAGCRRDRGDLGCHKGMVCFDGTCKAGCIDDDDCRKRIGGEVDYGQICVDPPLDFHEPKKCRRGCRDDSDCDEDQYCRVETGTCKPGCTTNSQCGGRFPDDTYCDLSSHKCAGGCYKSAQCPRNHNCIRHECVSDGSRESFE
jgi:hypothetical protein